MIDQLLIDLHACPEAREWAKGKDLHTVWSACERGNWLLWLASRMIDKPGWHTHQEIVLAACACAESALKHVPDGEARPREAIEMARKWARGKATVKQVKSAAAAASVAAYAFSAASNAAYAFSAASNAASVAFGAYAYAAAEASSVAYASTAYASTAAAYAAASVTGAYAAANAAVAAAAASVAASVASVTGAYAAADVAYAMADIVRIHLKEPK